MAALSAPHLSTVRLPLREMGRRGFDAAMRIQNGEAIEPQAPGSPAGDPPWP